MSPGRNMGGRGAEKLTEGCVVGGNVLRSLVAASDVSCLWQTDAPADAEAPRCIRTIPEANFVTDKARRRFRPELGFWMTRPGAGVVPLYQCGCDSGQYFMVMQFMAEGSLADKYAPSLWKGEKLLNLALALADVMRQLHSSSGPHGNLKPGNVFPLSDGRALVSDFLVPLWLDELEAGSILGSHLQHPYRAPEQREDPHDYDTRSDVYSYGLILLQCLTGAVPLLGDGDPNDVTAEWPSEMLPVISCCLDADRERRYADGPELYDALSRATERHAPAAPPVAQAQDAAGRVESVWLEWDEAETAHRVAQAGELVRQGHLETALEMVESLPPGTPGVEGILDDIEHRDQVSADLATEALRLASTGDMTAALNAVEEAEQLFHKSETVRSVKADLAALQGPQRPAPPAAQIPSAAEDALAAERYEVARAMLEKLLREGKQSPELAEQVRRFKRGRARKGFLENVRDARRFYLRGEHTVSAQRWLEAARWLAPGPRREHLRRIAKAAAKGTLRLDVQMLAASAQADSQQEAELPESPTSPPLPEAVQEKLDAAALLVAESDRRRLLILLAILALLFGAGLAIVLAIWL